MGKFKTIKCKCRYFRGGSNLFPDIITCKGKICIPLILQIYVLN